MTAVQRGQGGLLAAGGPEESEWTKSWYTGTQLTSLAQPWHPSSTLACSRQRAPHKVHHLKTFPENQNGCGPGLGPTVSRAIISEGPAAWLTAGFALLWFLEA